MDEIDEVERGRLLKQLLQLCETCEDAKIFISSRAEDDISRLLKDKATIRVDDRNAGSIQRYVTQRIREWFLERMFLPEAQTEIQALLAPLSSKSKGRVFLGDLINHRSNVFRHVSLRRYSPKEHMVFG